MQPIVNFSSMVNKTSVRVFSFYGNDTTGPDFGIRIFVCGVLSVVVYRMNQSSVVHITAAWMFLFFIIVIIIICSQNTNLIKRASEDS